MHLLKNNYLMRTVLVFLLLMIRNGVHAQEPDLSWLIADLAKTKTQSIELKNRSGTIIERLNVSQILLIDGVYKGLCEVTETCPRFLLIEGASPNALAAPVGSAGTVMINLGITRMIGYDSSQWAAVLGHEIAHLKLDHVTERLSVSLPMELAEAILRDSTNSGYGILAGEYGRQLIETTFSRDQEHESDYLGAIWALEAGFEVEGAVRLQAGLLKRYGHRAQLPFLLSHPTSQERIERLQGLADRLRPER
jgi:Zn-dependent protease with chaperone function